jgi:hypothetical protein
VKLSRGARDFRRIGDTASLLHQVTWLKGGEQWHGAWQTGMSGTLQDSVPAYAAGTRVSGKRILQTALFKDALILDTILLL